METLVGEEDEEEQISDIYNFPETFIDSDKISNSEAGFMKGYNDS